MIRVLICDDHQIVRKGIQQIVAGAAGIALGGEAATGPKAMARARRRHHRGVDGAQPRRFLHST